MRPWLLDGSGLGRCVRRSCYRLSKLTVALVRGIFVLASAVAPAYGVAVELPRLLEPPAELDTSGGAIYSAEQFFQWFDVVCSPGDAIRPAKFHRNLSARIYQTMVRCAAFYFQKHLTQPTLYRSGEFWLRSTPPWVGDREVVYAPWLSYRRLMSPGNLTMFLYVLSISAVVAFQWSKWIGIETVHLRHVHKEFGRRLSVLNKAGVDGRYRNDAVRSVEVLFVAILTKGQVTTFGHYPKQNPTPVVCPGARGKLTSLLW